MTSSRHRPDLGAVVVDFPSIAAAAIAAGAFAGYFIAGLLHANAREPLSSVNAVTGWIVVALGVFLAAAAAAAATSALVFHVPVEDRDRRRSGDGT